MKLAIEMKDVRVDGFPEDRDCYFWVEGTGLVQGFPRISDEYDIFGRVVTEEHAKRRPGDVVWEQFGRVGREGDVHEMVFFWCTVDDLHLLHSASRQSETS